jgi:HEAT repeat protein
VRRAAIDLLRNLGGEAALPDLQKMLDDTDSQVQREALRAIIQIGTAEAYRLLENALERGAERTRDAIMQGLGAFRDEKAAPLFVYLLKNTEYKGAHEANYVATIESLGKVATDERSAAALKDILYRGEWWSWGRTARLRMAAARALRGMGTPGADRVLEEAATSGPGAVKKTARAVLLEPAPSRCTRKEKDAAQEKEKEA